MASEKPYKVEVRIELSKGYDDLEKQTVEISVDSIGEATEIWKAITAITRQYSMIKPVS